MNEKLVIIGIGEFATLAYEYFTHDSQYEVVAFCADAEFISERRMFGLPVVDFVQLQRDYPSDAYHVYVAVTHTRLNRVRKALFERVKDLGYRCATYISSRAFVWHNAEIGENVFIFEDNVIQPFTCIGNNVVLWSGNHIGHRTRILDHCYVSSHVVLSGYCVVESGCFIGVNATVGDRITIAEDNFIGAGAIISKNTKPNAVYQPVATVPSRVSARRLFKIKEDTDVD